MWLDDGVEGDVNEIGASAGTRIRDVQDESGAADRSSAGRPECGYAVAKE
jgi:hypothetical protein